MKNTAKYLRRCLEGLLLIAVVAALVVCNIGGYETFTLTEGIGHFSFKYPSRYELESVRMESLLGEKTYVTLYTQPTNEGVALHHDAEILVYIETAGDRVANSGEAVESTIYWWTSRGYDDFQLLARSDIEFDGTRGEQITYSFDSYHLEDVHIGMHLVNTPVIRKAVIFDYDGLIWHISVAGYENIATTVKEDFDYILYTFHILD